MNNFYTYFNQIKQQKDTEMKELVKTVSPMYSCLKQKFVQCPRCFGHKHYIRLVRWFFNLFSFKKRVPCEVCHETGKVDVQPAKCPKCGQQLNKWKIGCVYASIGGGLEKWYHGKCYNLLREKEDEIDNTNANRSFTHTAGSSRKL